MVFLIQIIIKTKTESFEIISTFLSTQLSTYRMDRYIFIISRQILVFLFS